MKLIATLMVASLFLISAAPASALPQKMAGKNPQVVSNYPGPDDIHGIVGEYEQHTGSDLVKLNGKSGSFQQWFYGESESEGTHGEHSMWKPSKDGSCPKNWDLVPADQFWGDHLIKDTVYCVKTNDFKNK